MRTFADKSKAIQHTTSPKATARTRPQFGDSHEVNFIRRLQRTVGNQAVQRLLQAKTENKKASSTSYETPGFGHDFSRIPVHADANNSNTKLKQELYGPEDILKQETNNIYFNSQLASTRSAFAVTHRGDIHISERAYFLPQSQFDLMFAHERVHVSQQSRTDGRIGSTNELESEADRLAPDIVAGKSVKPKLRAEAATYLQQNQPDSITPQPVDISTNRNEQTQLIDLVNQRLHEKYGIAIQGTDRLTRSRVHFLPGNQFGQSLHGSDIRSLLFTLFRSANRPLILTNILYHAGMGGCNRRRITHIHPASCCGRKF